MSYNGSKPKCPQGHEYSEENTYTTPVGARQCRKCSKARMARRRAALPPSNMTPLQKARHEEKRLIRKYGITSQKYEEMYAEQLGRCAGCKESFEKLCIDHDHSTGAVRGLLCHNCNKSLGLLKDSPETLENPVAYLRRK